MSAESSRPAIRAKIVLACAQPGVSNARASRDLGISLGTVRMWRAAFAQGGWMPWWMRCGPAGVFTNRRGLHRVGDGDDRFP
ncbi:helix-turn-helix domain-containing protein [Nonomuraea angiospora]|uniref:helix-turn-helix domain-containing protein n=1 Tax=Nonomuraea angiospora TaxID=46172 RepID=UPI0034394652